jgi:hypothetical protein
MLAPISHPHQVTWSRNTTRLPARARSPDTSAPTTTQSASGKLAREKPVLQPKNSFPVARCPKWGKKENRVASRRPERIIPTEICAFQWRVTPTGATLVILLAAVCQSGKVILCLLHKFKFAKCSFQFVLWPVILRWIC